MNNNFSEEKELLEMFRKDIERYPVLSREEELTFARKAYTGDKKSLDSLVVANLRFVYKVVYRHWSPGLPLMDMISEGCMGLIRAAQKYEPEKGFRFLTYAEWWINQKIFRLLKNHGKHDHKSIDKPAYDDSEMTVADKLSSENDVELDEGCYHNQAKEWLEDLNERERKIIVLKFWNDMSLKEIGSRVGLSKSQVRSYEAKGLRKIRWTLLYLNPGKQIKDEKF